MDKKERMEDRTFKYAVIILFIIANVLLVLFVGTLLSGVWDAEKCAYWEDRNALGKVWIRNEQIKHGELSGLSECNIGSYDIKLDKNKTDFWESTLKPQSDEVER